MQRKTHPKTPSATDKPRFHPTSPFPFKMMHSTTAVLGLIAAVSAIDIHLHNQRNCEGKAAVTCFNVNPNTCCGIMPIEFWSINFLAVPGDWNLDTRAHRGGYCGEVKDGARKRGDVCLLNNGPFSGGGYSFANKKRSGGALFERAAETCSTSECAGYQAPDLLTLEDGTTMNIKGLEESKVVELIKLSTTGVGAEAIPQEFAARINKA